MKKLFCDCCNKEVDKLNEIEFKTHIKEVCESGVNLSGGYVDNEGNPVSGRYEYIEVCNYCYNSIMSSMYSEFKSLKKE